MMDVNEMAEVVVREIRLSVAEWRKLPQLLESGRLVKGKGGWYRVKDHTALSEVKRLIRGFRTNSRPGTTAQVKLATPTKKFIAIADRANGG